MTEYSYEITPRSKELGGWKLSLIQDREEVGGGVFETRKDALEEALDWIDTRPLNDQAPC